MKKGRSDGTTEKAQRDKPFFAAARLLDENKIRKIVNVYIHMGIIICFNLKIINLVFLVKINPSYITYILFFS